MSVKDDLLVLVGQNFQLNLIELDSIYGDKNKPYQWEAEQEAISVYTSPVNLRGDGSVKQTLMEKINNCKKGMLAELALREIFQGLVPVTAESLNKYASRDWLALNDALEGFDDMVKYHDLIDIETGEVFEVKNWSMANWRSNLEKWETSHRKYNFSHHIVIFVEDYPHLQLVELKSYDVTTAGRAAPQLTTSKRQVFQYGSSFTIMQNEVNHLKKNPDDTLVFIDGNRTIAEKPASWFIANMRASNRGADAGGYYVFRSQLR